MRKEKRKSDLRDVSEEKSSRGEKMEEVWGRWRLVQTQIGERRGSEIQKG